MTTDTQRPEMEDLRRGDWFEKLNALCRRALDNSMEIARSRGNPEAGIPHFFEQLVRIDNTDLNRILNHFGIDASLFIDDIVDTLNRLPKSGFKDLSDDLFRAFERGYARGSVPQGEESIRSGHILLGMLRTQWLREELQSISPLIDRIDIRALAEGFPGIVKGSAEHGLGMDVSSLVRQDTSTTGEEKIALSTYAIDLTAKARDEGMDPVVGREVEIRQLVNILMRRRQNNPILTGEAGVGKTAVVEGLAQRIVAGDVPPQLKDVELWALDIGLLQAGASMKGEFENRLRQVIQDVQGSATPIILFIDEAHTLIGAGGAAGTGDAANLLKPALARGELRTVAATTWAEYKKHIEKDPALTRRFEVVKVEEPEIVKALMMIRSMAATLESHHWVQITDEALKATVELSARYIPARQLPDKAISLLDTACAGVRVSQHATPAAIETLSRRIDALETEARIVEREGAMGIDSGDRTAEITTDLESLRGELATLEERWVKEKTLVEKILDLRTKLRNAMDDGPDAAEADPVSPPDAVPGERDVQDTSPDAAGEESPDFEAMKTTLRDKLAELENLQDDAPLILPFVDRQAIARIVEDWTGIPVGTMVKDEIDTILNLPDFLCKRVIGQGHAMEMIARRIQTSRAGLDAPNKPVGVFMLCGPSGVGKTETALALAETLYGGEQNLITINMSEFQEAHSVSTLKGSPPGYVGYGEGGVLTEAVRRRPYSVVLLDEVEKAHSDVHEIFFQVFDKGIMEDGEGRQIDFKNTLIILTSNVGSDLIMSMCEDPELAPEPDAMAKALRTPLLDVFPAALLGRLVVIPYVPLNDSMINMIATLQLNRIKSRIASVHGAQFEYGDNVLALIRERCTEPESGGRVIDAILTNTMLPKISRAFLDRNAKDDPIRKVAVIVKDGDFQYTLE